MANIYCCLYGPNFVLSMVYILSQSFQHYFVDKLIIFFPNLTDRKLRQREVARFQIRTSWLHAVLFSCSLSPPSFFLLLHPSIPSTHTTSSEFTEIYFAYHIPYRFQVDNQWFLVNLSRCASITIKHKPDRTFLSSQWEPSYPLLILVSHPSHCTRQPSIFLSL